MNNEISPLELYQELQGDNPPKLLDVREDHELKVSRIENLDAHIPLTMLPDRFEELDPTQNWVVICRSGGRSGTATAFLTARGFSNVRNMVTGMNGWAQTVDTTLPVY